MCKTGSMCRSIMAVLILAAGAVLFGNIALAGLTALQVAGVLLILVGLGKLVHCLGMCGTCSMCNMPDMAKDQKAGKK